MATFPQTLYPEFGYKSWQEENIIRNDPRSGKFQELDMWGRTIFMAEMRFRLRTDDGLTVYGFWKKNRAANFLFFDYEDDQYYLTRIGTGDAVTTTFTIPAKATRTQAVYVNSVLKTAGVDYNITVGTGANGEDRVVFIAGHIPAAAAVIEADYKGKGLFTCVWSRRPEKESTQRGIITLTVAVMEQIP